MNGSSSNGKLYFNPQATMTRTEVMTVIGRCLPRGYAAVSLNYTDASVIPSWATERVKTCVSAGVIGGYRMVPSDRTAISPAVRLRKFWLCSDSCRTTAIFNKNTRQENLDGCSVCQKAVFPTLVLCGSTHKIERPKIPGKHVSRNLYKREEKCAQGAVFFKFDFESGCRAATSTSRKRSFSTALNTRQEKS